MKCTLLNITSNHRVTCPFNIDPYRCDTCIIKLVVRMKESEIQSGKYVCLCVIHQHDLIISLSFPPLRLTLRFDFSRNCKNASLKIKAASWRRFPSNVICTRVFSSASLWCRDSDRACITLCFSRQTQMGAAGGGRWSSREGASATDQVWQEHLHLSACGLCPWLKLSLVSRGECRGAVSRRHRLVWKISAISVSASGLMRTRGAEPGKGCSFVWVPISIKQQ